MLKNTTLLLLATLAFKIDLAAQHVYIPDIGFKAHLLSHPMINSNSDSEIQVSEANSYTGEIDVSGMGINNLTGIEEFENISNLDCSFNNISFLDLSLNTSLNVVHCSYNPLTTLNVNGLSNLKILHCVSFALTDLYLSSNSALEELICSHNPLGELDLSYNPGLRYLVCENNQLSYLDLSNNPALLHLDCSNNYLTSLDLSSNPILQRILCDNNELAALDLSSNDSVYDILASYNQISVIDLSNLLQLRNFVVEFNPLASLDLSNNPILKWLSCGYNELTLLNLKNGNNVNLEHFESRHNPGLTCIQVDDILVMNTEWSTNKDTFSFFSNDCSITTTIGEVSITEFTLLPASGNGIFEVLSTSADDFDVIIYNGLGMCIFGKSNVVQSLSMDISSHPVGLYFIEISDRQSSKVFRFFKN
jgi:hypothetical protein